MKMDQDKSRNLSDYVNQEITSLEQEYLHLDSNFKKIPDYRRPRIHSANNKKIFYSLHGFLGTPEEMTILDEPLKNLGFDIYHDLIPGFGSHAEICNDYTSEDWLKDFQKKLEFLGNHYEEIVLCGFSTGALIIHSQLRNGIDSKIKAKIKGLIFFSPYYLSTFKTAGPVIRRFAGLLKTFSLQWLYRLTGIQDLQVMLFKPQYYLQKIPLLSAFQINLMGREVFKSSLSQKMDIPMMVFLTKVDKVANPVISEQVVKRDFERVSLKLFENPLIPHHLMVPEVNLEIEEVKNLSRNFISSLLGFA